VKSLPENAIPHHRPNFTESLTITERISVHSMVMLKIINDLMNEQIDLALIRARCECIVVC